MKICNFLAGGRRYRARWAASKASMSLYAVRESPTRAHCVSYRARSASNRTTSVRAQKGGVPKDSGRRLQFMR